MRSGFFNSHLGDRKYSAEDWADYFRQFIGNGVYANPAISMQVQAAGKLTVRIAAGSCFINGYVGYSDGSDVLKLKYGGTYPRIDRIVIRLDMTTRSIYPAVIMGNEAETPSPPDIIRKSSVYDLCAAEITVGANVTEIRQSDIKDMRFDTDVCGIVAGLIDQIDTDDYISQMTAAITAASELALLTVSAEWNKFLDSVLTKDGNVIITLPNEELKSEVARLKRGRSVADLFHVI
ncbi:MAG: hypothetical protein K2J73_05485 [Oscillospiraceae bacterium]|nr:hypothetical protein [Oscillospiraceae bacterium]